MIQETSSLIESALSQNQDELISFLETLTQEEAQILKYTWEIWARPAQLPPPEDWDFWLILAGRGWGKTKTGAEWVIDKAYHNPGCVIHGIAPTIPDTRDTMVEGESGILTISPPWFRCEYIPSRRLVRWPNGSKMLLFTGEEPERLRGPQCHYLWADELCAWRYCQETFDMAMFGFRLGSHPQAVITTTPKPTPQIKELMKNPRCVVTGGNTYENKNNLAPTFFSQILTKYEGTRLGLQEIHAKILDDVPGALWTQSLIHKYRVSYTEIPDFVLVYTAVDPEATSEETSSETGIITSGKSKDGHFYVLDDSSVRDTPLKWATKAVNAYYDNQGDAIIGEINNGGEMVESTIKTVDANVTYKPVRASRGKYTRAHPIASLYEKGFVHHVGVFSQLEEQMCNWVPGEKSPDRMDALVWCIASLMEGTSSIGTKTANPFANKYQQGRMTDRERRRSMLR